MITKRGWVFIGIIVAVIMTIIFTIQYYNSPQYVETRVDKDTGEKVYVEPNKTPEQFNDNGRPTFLGLAALTDLGMTQSQIDTLMEGLSTYTTKKSDEKIELVKLLKDEMVMENNVITTRVRFNENKSTSVIRIELKSLDLIRFYLSNDGKQVYDSGDLSVTYPQVEFEHDQE